MTGLCSDKAIETAPPSVQQPRLRHVGATIEYRCPRCRGGLRNDSATYVCPRCERVYPITLGIPDFRLRPDPYIGIAEDREKGLQLARDGAGRDLRGLLELYWSITAEVEQARAERFVETTLAARDRAEDILTWMDDHGLVTSIPRLLEIGCGAGIALPVSARRGTVAGVDRAFRWLVLARLSLERGGFDIPLACADARELPFAEGSFDVVVTDNVIEHNATNQEDILREAARVLVPAGTLFVSTPNRLCPIPDPHFRVWGLGFLPARWRHAPVRWIRNREYRHIRLLAAPELRRMLKRIGLSAVSVCPARFGRGTRARFGVFRAGLLRLHETSRRIAPLRWLLVGFGPVLWAVGRKAESEMPSS
jgi:SAM-dependent methyltransferase/uncharacterized protein YbaR (Trm112 family)